MKLEPGDFPKLQFSLLAMLLMVILGVASVLYSQEKTRLAQNVFAATQSERNEFDGKLKRVRNEENDIRQRAALFNTLQDRGVVGEEQRLEWIELLKAIRDRHRLIDLRYEFTPRHSLEKGATGPLALYASTMRLQLSLLHEEDLTRVLDDLHREARALIQVKRCDVSRLSRSGTDNALRGLLQAECIIDWVTLSESESEKGKGSTK